MENKYQEAVKELKDFIHSELDGTRMLDGYLKHCDTLQELVDQNKEYTLEEIKKEWEEMGYEWKEIEYKEGLKAIILEEHCECQYDEHICIYIRLIDKTYSVVQFIPFEVHNLLTKTIKALKKEEK